MCGAAHGRSAAGAAVASPVPERVPVVPALAERVAVWISRLGHPVVLIPLSTLRAPRAGAGGVALMVGPLVAVAALIALPILAVMAYGVWRGRWRDYDVSVRAERVGFFRILMVVLPLGTVALWMLYPGIRRGLLAGWALVIVSTIVNRWLKTSMHVGVAAFCATLVAGTPWIAIAAALTVALIAWSRLVLKRHTRLEVACGAILGTTAGLAVRFL